jgi:hypothetical protein
MQLDQYGSFYAIKLIVIFYQGKKKKTKKQSKILPSISCLGPTFSSLNTSVSTYKGVTPNHWKKCIYALGMVFRLGVFFGQANKGTHSNEKLQSWEAFTLRLVSEAIQQAPVMHLCEPNKNIKKLEQ